MGKQKQEEDEDNRREVAIASTLSLQPNFKPVGVTPQQLSKFQELHRRRLQIKAKSKIHKKLKGRAERFRAEYMNSADSLESDLNTRVEDESVLDPKSHGEDDNPFSLQEDNEVVQIATKKRQKLHWGLDTKERWERKANM
ncbi:Plastid hexose transporter isoform 1 [Hibiscus syriacus]|uniref:Plastid hexose transporter isoform 1 n=1 Tax=Hibiscus syriacus TaxID=106335 RepID=A0A6A2WG37_HIBSY|nr:uncharacterized protein LOC120196808 [Hibiscus syriacus]KAE8654965.1 Plastid hexose transporter isoform 1 [Hibiscus syriacus]